MDATVVLSLKDVTKKYPGVLALDRVSLDFVAGEVHALLGENGAGKSTLIKAVAGAISLDGGLIRVGGQDHPQMTPHVSRRMGIEVIYQEFNLVPTMSVAENVFLGDRIGNSRLVGDISLSCRWRRHAPQPHRHRPVQVRGMEGERSDTAGEEPRLLEAGPALP